jgi:hypothetical protein
MKRSLLQGRARTRIRPSAKVSSFCRAVVSLLPPSSGRRARPYQIDTPLGRSLAKRSTQLVDHHEVRREVVALGRWTSAFTSASRSKKEPSTVAKSASAPPIFTCVLCTDDTCGRPEGPPGRMWNVNRPFARRLELRVYNRRAAHSEPGHYRGLRVVGSGSLQTRRTSSSR